MMMQIAICALVDERRRDANPDGASFSPLLHHQIAPPKYMCTCTESAAVVAVRVCALNDEEGGNRIQFYYYYYSSGWPWTVLLDVDGAVKAQEGRDDLQMQRAEDVDYCDIG